MPAELKEGTRVTLKMPRGQSIPTVLQSTGETDEFVLHRTDTDLDYGRFTRAELERGIELGNILVEEEVGEELLFVTVKFKGIPRMDMIREVVTVLESVQEGFLEDLRESQGPEAQVTFSVEGTPESIQKGKGSSRETQTVLPGDVGNARNILGDLG